MPTWLIFRIVSGRLTDLIDWAGDKSSISPTFASVTSEVVVMDHPSRHRCCPTESQDEIQVKIRVCLAALIAGELFLFLLLVSVSSGCAGRRYAHIMKGNDIDMVGSHDAGAAVWNPLVDEAVAKMLSRCPPAVQQVGFESQMPIDPTTGQPTPGISTICFVGIDNKSVEEMLDFKDQLYERIDSQINGAPQFRSVSRRMVDAALIETRLRPDSLFLPDNRAIFASALGRQGTPVDMLMYATITSGTTDRNSSTQRDYLLTLEMVNLQSGEYVKESAKIRKGYHSTRAGKWWNFGLGQGDG